MSLSPICNLKFGIKRSVAAPALLYAGLLRKHGFTDVTVESIRKRNSKKELFEFLVSGKFSAWTSTFKK